jgi:hypothetical protein
MAGVEISVPPPPPTASIEARGKAFVPDELDEGRTIAGAEIDIPPPPEATPLSAAVGVGTRELGPSGGANYFIRLRREDEADDGRTITGAEVITIGSGMDQVLRIDHELVGESHARVVYRKERFELSALEGQGVELNGKPLEKATVLFRDDLIRLAGEGGPSFKVDMLYPNNERAKSGGLPEALGFLEPVVAPIAKALGMSPMVAFLGLVFVVLGIGLCVCSGLMAVVYSVTRG